jgi:NAD(P)-dependent dehydrogenase (short-subunit alcohol dehydrogenase family)
MQRLVGKVAIVTGGAGALGSATAERLVAEGANVVVADIDLEGAEKVAAAIGASAVARHYDATQEDSVRSVIDDVVKQFGRLDVLHNNAAMTSGPLFARDTTVVDTGMDVWDATYAVNLRGYVLGCKFAIPHLIAGGGGVIINMSSCAAFGGDVARIAYGTSKGAILTFTKYVAAAHGKDGVRCVGVSPGVVLTDLMREYVGEAGLGMLERQHLTNYLGETKDIAALVAFLASDEAKYITGVTFQSDGGMLSHMPNFADALTGG